MNKIFFLLITFSLSTAGLANAQNRRKGNLKRAFNHTSGTNTGKNDRAHFRRQSIIPVIDLNPHSPGKFKTARANHHYKFAK